MKDLYYVIENNTIQKKTQMDFLYQDDSFCILTHKQWQEDKELRAGLGLRLKPEEIHFCKVENHQGYLYGTMHIPSKKVEKEFARFAFYLLPERLVFLDDDGVVEKRIKKITAETLREGYTLERFFYDFLVYFFEEDLLYLQGLEAKIGQLEEDVLQGKSEKFSYRMLELKKRIACFNRYYSQLTDLGQELRDNETDFFGQDDVQRFHRFRDRAQRLEEETGRLREYAMQVQDVYQAQIGIRQNDVMKMLTIVTTIFLPLTLIAGWYGMNFIYMPELHSKLGYPVVILGSLLIVVVSLIIFKKRKYF